LVDFRISLLAREVFAMRHSDPTRREFVCQLGAVGGSVLLGAALGRRAEAQGGGKLHVASNQYPWGVFYKRDGRNFAKSLDAGFAEVAQSGMDGFEPSATGPEQIDQMVPLLKQHGLQMRSVYVGSLLHDAAKVAENIDNVVAIAERAKAAGTKIIVTNPSPIRWGGQENKDDAQLKVQAAALDKLGAKLQAIGITLAYHNHDIELRNAAREFHHMMLGTDPGHVSLCLDAHWVYRGAGNSAVALFDVLKLYGPRISELHLRQSAGNIWTEALGDGDIDYPALAKHLLAIGVKPHLVLEQAPEAGTPKTIDAIESHRRSRQYVEQVFVGFAT
jgi:inosose dehydratase